MSGADLDDLIVSAQRAAGVLSARHRGDSHGVDALMAGFAGYEDLAGGALLLAKLALTAQARATGLSFEDCVEQTTLALATGAHTA